MSTPPPFQFAFDATSTMPDALPYVARLQWNPKLNRIEHQLFPLQQELLSATDTRVFGHFRATPMDIIETRRGALTRKRKRLDLISWFLVVPRGCLVLIGEGHDTTAAERIRKFLSGTLSVNQLGRIRLDRPPIRSPPRIATTTGRVSRRSSKDALERTPRNRK